MNKSTKQGEPRHLENLLVGAVADLIKVNARLVELEQEIAEQEARIDRLSVEQQKQESPRLSITEAAKKYRLTYAGMLTRVHRGKVPIRYGQDGKGFFLKEELDHHRATGNFPESYCVAV